MFCYVYKKKKWTWNFWVKLDLYYALGIKRGFLVDFMDFDGCQGKPLEHTVLVKFSLAPCYISFVLIGCFGKFGFCLHQTIKLHSVKCTVKC